MAGKKKTKKAAKTATKTTATTKNWKPGPIPSVNRPRTKSEIMAVLADQTGLTKRDVTTIFASLGTLIGNDVGKKGPGIFTVPGMMKIVRVNKPATKARKGINPFTGQEMIFKAKPARSVVKIRPLKALKEMV